MTNLSTRPLLILTTLIGLVGFLLPSQAQALTVTINSSGLIEIFAGSVLGERSDNPRAAAASQNRADLGAANQVAPQAPVERINPGTTKRIEFSREGNVSKMEVIKADPAENKLQTTTENRQRFETDQLEAQLPARYQIEPDQIQAMPEPVREIVRERTQRQDESLRLESSNEKPALISRQVRSHLPAAAISFNPETNSVWVTTPSGIERELTHLPDQAPDRMSNLRALPSEAELEMITVEDRVLYRVPTQVERRILGLFKRTVQTEVLLDDQTGEIGERQLPSRSIFGQFLDFISI